MQPSPLADDDVRSIVKLLGDIAGMNDSLEHKPHTPGDYIKEIYSRFNVGSQASLISRFYQGDGGDTP